MANHQIVHIEIPAKDREAAAKFYNSLFGWDVQQIPEMNYATFSTGEGGVGGGFNPVSADNPPDRVIVYVSTDDIDESLRQAVALGGTVVQPCMEIPGMGYFAHFKDPSGNTIALFKELNMG